MSTASPSDDGDGAALADHLAAQLATFARFLAAWTLAVNAAWWPTDRLLLSAVPGAVPAFLGVRLSVQGGSVAVLALLHGQRALRGARLALVEAAWCAEVAAMGWSVSRIGDLSTPWFLGMSPVVIVSCVMALDLRERAVFTTALGASALAGFVAGRPDAVRPPYFAPTVFYLAFAVGVGVAFGHRLYLLTCENFAQRRVVEAQREGLRREVDARTAELRQLTGHLDRRSEEERHRIARDLHDDVGQSVSALRLSLAAARRRFGRDPASIGENLEDLDELVRRVADGTREAITRLRPRVLDETGLAAAAEWLVRVSGRHGGPAFELRIEGEDPCAPGAEAEGRRVDDVSLAAFRVLQEAVHNAVRHAGATRVDVTLRFDDGVDVQVDDDGVGLPADGARRDGLGLVGMRERASALGGSFAVGPRPGGGTSLRCRLPRAATEAAG